MLVSLEACIEIFVSIRIEEEIGPGEICRKGRIIVGQSMGIEKFAGITENCQKLNLSQATRENGDTAEDVDALVSGAT
jgi:hypothetical protein